MLSLPMPDGPLLSAIAWLYLITNATRVVTYLPRIVVVWRCTDGAVSVSLLTWGSWVLSQATALLYGVLVVHDMPFVLISLINFIGCGCVTAIAMRRRAQWKQRRDARTEHATATGLADAPGQAVLVRSPMSRRRP